MAELTVDHLNKIFENAPEGDVEEEFPYIIDVLRRYDIGTRPRIAAFLANVAKESGELVYVEEIADGWAYEGRSDLGNTQPGDGPLFKGRGYIQITGRHNYTKVAEALYIDCVSDPYILLEPQWAWKSAGWYWAHGSSWGNLNDYADDEDFASTVLGVRGGPDEDRWRYWFRAMHVLPTDVELPDLEKPIEVEPEKPIEVEPEKPAGPVITVDGWPAMEVEVDKQGWAIEKTTKAYLLLPEGVTLKGNASRWGHRVEKVKPVDKVEPITVEKWAWPVANTPPKSGNYVARHPTRYNWRSDIEEWARYLVDAYPKKVWCNSYYDHPEGYGRDSTSFDVWDYSGRGADIDFNIGQEIFNLLFYYEGAPNIDWIIWNATIYGAWNGWNGEPFGTEKFSWHIDHIHVTYH